MLAVRFDIVIPSVGQSYTNPVDENTEILSVVFSVTCNIFFGAPKKPSQSEQNSTPNFFGNDNNNNNGNDDIQFLVQYIIQPYLIVTNVPKNKEIQKSRELAKFRTLRNYSENSASSEALPDKSVAFLVPIAKTEVVFLPKKPIFPFLGQLSDLLHLDLKFAPTLPPGIPDLIPVSKLGIPAVPLSQPAEPIPEDPVVTENPPASIPASPEPEFVIKIRKILSENSPDDVELCDEGVGGTYFIRDHRTPLAVFKPSDEEPGAILNPKKKLDKPLLPPGGGARREYAAYALDEGHAGVPETHLVQNFSHRKMSNGGSLPIPKSGSLQRFVANKGSSSSMSPSRFPVEEVHAVAILDLRLLNLDRNGENLLVCTADDPKGGNGIHLVPIDHTYVLPPTLDYDPYFEWHYWRQTKEPLSPAHRSYIASLDPERDAQRLRAAGLDEESIRTMRIATLLLQKGAEVGLTLFDMANMVCRGRNKKSELSEIVVRAENAKTEFWSEFSSLVEQAVHSKKGQ